MQPPPTPKYTGTQQEHLRIYYCLRQMIIDIFHQIWKDSHIFLTFQGCHAISQDLVGKKQSLQNEMDSSASVRYKQQHPSSAKDSMDLGSTLTVFLLAMVAGWSSSVIFFHVTWFRIRTWLRKRGKGRLLGQSSPDGSDKRGRKHFPPFHQSCQWPGTGCWDSRRLIWHPGATRRRGRRRAAARRGSTAGPCTETQTEPL